MSRTEPSSHPADDSTGVSAGRPSRRGVTLIPREHGVYAEVGFPIFTALWIGHWSPGGICFAIAIIAAFLMHEPVLVLLGRRGGRVKTNLGSQAKRQLLLLAPVVLACGLIGLWRAEADVRLAFLLLVPVTVPLAFLIVTKQEKTFFGESFVALVLSLASVPVTMAGGADLIVAVAAAAAWTAAFVTSTATVHAILTRSKRHTDVPTTIVAALALLVAVGAVVAFMLGGPVPLLALVPAPLVAFGVITARLPVRRLRTLGWWLVAGNFATAILLVVTLA
ncbi:MAG TPA: YwiC-like family protein [Candidatus Krumholzibacteria bacterium]|nr:YwiC-like family protein [Candidatus Krumholzibacteria bacterium]